MYQQKEASMAMAIVTKKDFDSVNVACSDWSLNVWSDIHDNMEGTHMQQLILHGIVDNDIIYDGILLVYHKVTF